MVEALEYPVQTEAELTTHETPSAHRCVRNKCFSDTIVEHSWCQCQGMSGYAKAVQNVHTISYISCGLLDDVSFMGSGSVSENVEACFKWYDVLLSVDLLSAY
uniref:Thyroglobulin type-1 domain-containing protein n=1 Tax=Angiostrongylus cantonensis TaxID=6313 RepID=A0A0K0D7M3_ANGCA